MSSHDHTILLKRHHRASLVRLILLYPVFGCPVCVADVGKLVNSKHCVTVPSTRPSQGRVTRDGCRVLCCLDLMEDTIIATGWVVKRNRTGILGGQAWRYLLFRARQKEGSPVELKGFYADDPDAVSARQVFDWADAKTLCFTLSDSSMTPSSLAAAAESPLTLGPKAPHAFPHDIQWLVLTTADSGEFSSFAFGAELPCVIYLAKRLAERGVPLGRLQVGGAATDPPHAPASAPSLYAGGGAVKFRRRRGRPAPPLSLARPGYCEKRGGGTSLFGSEAFKRRFVVILRGERAGQGG